MTKQFQYSVLRDMFPKLDIYRNDFGGWDVVEITDERYENTHFYKFDDTMPVHHGTIIVDLNDMEF